MVVTPSSRERVRFAAVHGVQPNMPPENPVAMWETWREEVAYGRG